LFKKDCKKVNIGSQNKLISIASKLRLTFVIKNPSNIF